jgi:UDP-4-amino-4,6-dideoxy-N-acetyl-beta-L-altrosamine N-acetyltransferase
MTFYLRPLTIKDREIIFQWRNSDSIRVNMYNDQPIPYKQHCQWFEDILNQQAAFYRLFGYQDKPLGLISFKNFNSQNQTCYWGFYIGESTAQKGTGTIMGYLAIDYAFEQLNIRKLIGEVLSFNPKSERFHQRLGFNREGLFIKELNRNGEYIDIIRFALFQDEWEKHKKNLNIHLPSKEDENSGN